jgi:choline-sulfatase
MNLLFIFSDQHSKEKTGCYGNPYVKTPNIDRLAEGGVRFTSAYTNCPICVPARAALATGRYVNQLQLWDNASPYIGGHPSWGHRLLAAGHRVTAIGKLHFRTPEDDTGFPDQRHPLHVRDGIGDLFGSIREMDARKPGLGKSVEEARPGESSYTAFDRQVAEEACRFLKEEGGSHEKPWALQVGFVLPHFPFISPQEYWDLYDEDALPLPKNYGKEDRPEHQSCRDLRHYMGIEEELPPEVRRRAVHAYYGMCSFVDDQIGRVLQALEEAGLQDSTRIIYSTDHGEMLGDHGLWYKNCMYEGAAGIPLIMAGPDLPRGSVVDDAVSLIDLFPTILEATGVVPDVQDSDLPGRSLLPQARGESGEIRPVFSEFHASGSLTAGFMLRRGSFKLIHYVGYPSQLFDLENDPDELVDLADNQQFSSVLMELEEELRKIVNPEEVDARAREDQTLLLGRYGGRNHIKSSFKPVIYSPVAPST